jgi:hypothetical protein
LFAVVAVANAAPQFDGVKNFFKSFSGNDDVAETSETVPYKTINKTINGDVVFEVREYPAVKWVCTDMTYEMDPTEVVEEEVESEFGMLDNLRKMMSGKSWKKKPSSKMFMRLFRYISGVNGERQEIEMTSPVLSKMSPNEDGTEMKNRMCFYLDSAAQANPPTPEEETVYLLTSEPLTVAVYEFGGYAMKDSVWMRRSAEFAEMLGDRANSVDTSNFYTAGYDSPMKFWNRRNEVMFELKK